MAFAKKYLVLYYSKTGNSQFLATRVAQNLNADLQVLKPPVSNVFFLFLLSRMNVPLGAGISEKDLEPYDEVVLLGPIWGGLVIAPLRTVIRLCKRLARPFHFAVSCETSDDEKEHKYGYAPVLHKARELGGHLMGAAAAFPTSLVEDPGKKKSPMVVSDKTRITLENYPGAMEARVEAFSREIRNWEPSGNRPN